MLFDPKWERVPTLRRFIAWLRGKPADEFYPWGDPGRCACAQFFGVGYAWYELNRDVVINEGVDLNELAYGGATPGRWKFGELLERAERELAKQEAIADAIEKVEHELHA